jgi:hypothetical protein
MLDSDNYKDEFGNKFGDVLSYPISEFVATDTPLEYILTQVDISRFDLLIWRVYGNQDYESFILWYNNILLISRMNPGDKILLPSATDISSWERSHLK